MAHQGTLFLDEIGDIALELQPKLLRVLQEGEFERLGSNKTHRVDVRLLAATNQNLHQMLAARQFRSDLYYRLNVFPISAPPLRERVEDIPLLVRYFAQKYARQMNKKITQIPTIPLEALLRWQWPGNVRELQNFVERAVILSRGDVLELPIAELEAVSQASAASDDTLEATEREHVVRVLREAKGVIGGPHGAAAKLGLKRTTLNVRERNRWTGLAENPRRRRGDRRLRNAGNGRVQCRCRNQASARGSTGLDGIRVCLSSRAGVKARELLPQQGPGTARAARMAEIPDP